MDPTTFVCVNPYEVNPLLESGMLSPTFATDISTQDQPSTIAQNLPMAECGEFYMSHRKIKMEMEEFGDLSPFVLPKPMMNSVDELNTPIFDKDAFDFDINHYSKDITEELFVKLEYDTYNGNTFSTSGNKETKNISLNTMNAHQKETIHSEIRNIHVKNVFSPESENESASYISNILTTSENNKYEYKVDNCALSVSSNDGQSFYILPADNQFQQLQKYLDTPENSNSSMISDKSNIKNSNLSVNTNLKISGIESVLATPIIIDEIVDLEANNFNILDLVGNEDIPYNADEILVDSSTVTLPSAEETTRTMVHQQNEFYRLAEKRTRKRKKHDNDDDDEEYLPSPRKQGAINKPVWKNSDFESDSDLDIGTKPRNKRRGRPLKQIRESISSDCSKDGEGFKYRELRAKNNEASRKSRLKRKVKEQELEKDAEALYSKNIKLKAQVEELEKMVNNFRDNLFRVMIRK